MGRVVNLSTKKREYSQGKAELFHFFMLPIESSTLWNHNPVEPWLVSELLFLVGMLFHVNVSLILQGEVLSVVFYKIVKGFSKLSL